VLSSKNSFSSGWLRSHRPGFRIGYSRGLNIPSCARRKHHKRNETRGDKVNRKVNDNAITPCFIWRATGRGNVGPCHAFWKAISDWRSGPHRPFPSGTSAPNCSRFNGWTRHASTKSALVGYGITSKHTCRSSFLFRKRKRSKAALWSSDHRNCSCQSSPTNRRPQRMI